jgi:hypothetical protein
MYEVSKRGLMPPNSVWAKGYRFSVVLILLADFLWVLLTTASLCHAVSFSSNPDQTAWITNGTVSAVATAGATVYIGGSFTYVGPNTGSGVPVDASSGSPVSSYAKVSGSILCCRL